MKKQKKIFSKILALMLAAVCCLSGCGDLGYEESNNLTYEEAVEELSSKLTKADES